MKSNVWCDRHLVSSPVFYGLCTSEAQFQKELRRMNIPRDQWPPFIKNEWSDATAHCFECKGKECVIVCIRGTENRDGIEIAGLLVHEAVHIWQQIRDNIGERDPSIEFEAYSIQAIAQGLMEAFADQVTVK